MYIYVMNVSPANKKANCNDPALIQAIKDACNLANQSTNSQRFQRVFTYIKEVDERTFQVQLQSKTAITPTRTISSISRALMQVCKSNPDLYQPLIYNNSVFSTILVQETKESQQTYENYQPHEIVQEVIDIFFGQNEKPNKTKQAAREAAEEIRKIVVQYKMKTDK